VVLTQKVRNTRAQPLRREDGEGTGEGGRGGGGKGGAKVRLMGNGRLGVGLRGCLWENGGT
jgi:hypothetical protein